jgi:ATP adenylyltransferase
MNRIWAPWRLEYVRSGDDDGCFLCRAVAEDGDRENLLLLRGLKCGVIMNRYPYNNGHLLVFPYRHVAEIADLERDERLEMMDLIDQSIEKLKAVASPDGFNVGFNLGKVAGAGLEEHLHAHIVPRWNGDTNFMPVLGDTKVIPQSLMDLYDELV